MAKSVKVKVSELVFDFNLYPRQQIDAGHLRNMMTAREAGIEFPPIYADRKSKRITDGFHRASLARRMHKEKAEIQVIFVDYESDQAMFLDALRRNASHGRNLTTYDRTHAIILADNLGLTHDVVAEALGMTISRVDELGTSRAAKSDGLKVPLKSTIRHMAGKRLTRGQQAANRKLGGMDAKFYARQLIMLLENDLLDKEDAELAPVLQRLIELLEGSVVA